jgi:hypothetical protein
MPAVDVSGGGEQPAIGAEVVTPHDTNELTYASRGLWVGGAGNVNVVTLAGNTVLFSGIAAGTLLPIRVKQVKSTNTTATLIVSLY